ncbi:MAG: YybH family protein [Bradyrhizobium sp.]
MSSMTEDTVSGIMEKWAAGFNRLDARALASLYSKDAFFFGSNTSLYRGNDGVAAYFDALPRWSSPTVRFTDVAVAPVGSDLINVAGTAAFLLDDAPPLSVKLTWVLVREEGDWKIISHHVSSTIPLIER